MSNVTSGTEISRCPMIGIPVSVGTYGDEYSITSMSFKAISTANGIGTGYTKIKPKKRKGYDHTAFSKRRQHR
jgi:hypothetical protein